MGFTSSFYYAAAFVALLTSSALLAKDKSKAVVAAEAASVQDVAIAVKVQDDSLDTVARLSTEAFYLERQGLLKLVNGDKFVRASIDKKTGETLFQVYLWWRHGGQWFFPDTANYETPSGPKSVESRRIDSDVSCSRYGCVYREDTAFSVPEADLRAIAVGAVPDGSVWQFKVSGKGGSTPPTAMLKTEIAGLLLAVDRKRQQLGLPVPQ